MVGGSPQPGLPSFGERPHMRARHRAKWATAFVTVAVVALAAVAIVTARHALADELVYDGDIVTIGVQTSIDLGEPDAGRGHQPHHRNQADLR